MADIADTPLTEAWKTIPGYPSYEASSFGRIRSVERTVEFIHRGVLKRRVWPSKVLKLRWKQMKGPKPYAFVDLSQRSDKRPFAVHYLVCSAFHGRRPARHMQAAHRDGDAENNRSDNLRWATPKENCADTLAHGRRLRGELKSNAKLKREDVLLIRRLRAAGNASQAQIAQQFGVCRGTISRIDRRTLWGWL